MKVVMYGTKACPDCVEAEEILKEKGIQYLYMEFSDNIGYLKRFSHSATQTRSLMK